MKKTQRYPYPIRSQAAGRIGLILVLSLIVLTMMVPGAAASHSHSPNNAINIDAILHDSRSDLYRTPGGAAPFDTEVTLRLRTATGNPSAVSVRVYNLRNQAQVVIPMQSVATTADGFDFWEATVTAGDETTVLYYRFIVQKDGETVFYEDDTFTDNGQYVMINKGGAGDAYVISRDGSYQIAVYDPEFYTPEWFRNGIIYQIFPDRFRDGDSANNPEDGSEVFYGDFPLIFHEVWNEPMIDGRVTTLEDGRGYWNSDFFGGDLAGITEKLDYLQDLGVTGIYLNPIFEARSNHRYDTADFLAVDPMLGTLEDFQALVSEAESRDIHIVLDAVFNHMSSDSAFFDRYHRFETDGACESLESPYRDWFYFRETRGTESAMCAGEDGNLFYDSWFNFDSIPRINNTLYGPRAYFVRGQESVARTWGAEGIGGWRMDVAGDIDNGRDPDNNYWESFRKVVRLTNPEAIIIGEEWQDATPWLLGDEWDATMNYRFRRAILGLVRGDDFVDNDGIIPGLTPDQFDNAIRGVEEDYPPMAYQALLNLIGSHDTSRLFFVMNNDTDLQKLAALVQFTLPGAPTIYYGDEIALDAPSQQEGSVYQDDPYNRAPYPWPDTEGDEYGPADADMLAFYQMLGQMRTENPALREGAMITLQADGSAGVYAFLRLDIENGNAALVAVNTSDAPVSTALDLSGLVPTGLTLEGVFSGDALSTDGGVVAIELGPHTGEVWVVSSDSDSFVTLSAPASVDGEGATGAVTVSWSGVENAAGYIVYRSPVTVGGFEPISDVVSDTSHVDTDITNGFVYHYAVATVGENRLIGELSSSVEATPADVIASAHFTDDTSATTTVTLAYGLTVPVRATVVIDGVTGNGEALPGLRAQATLSVTGEVPDWQPMTYIGSEDGADIYGADLAVLSAGDLAIQVRFSTDAGQSWTPATLPSGEVPVLVGERSDDGQPPGTPADFLITQASIASVDLMWSSVEADDLAVYRIYRTVNDATFLIAELAPDATNYTDTAVLPGNTYSYAIAAVDTALNESEQAVTREALVDRALLPVTFLVHVPDTTDGTLYLAGDLGSDTLPFWDPAGIEMTQLDPQTWAVTLDFAEGTNLAYKYARGSWEGVEKGEECEEIADRRLTVSLETLGDIAEDGTYVVEHTIAKWRDLDSCP